MTTPAPAHILLLGGSGRTGQLIITEALTRKHTVTTLVRKASSICPQANLSIIEGSPLRKTDVEKTLSSIPKDKQIVVMSALSQTRASGNPWAKVISPKRLMADAIENIISVAKEQPGRIEKIVVMSMFGTGASFTNLALFMRWVMRGSNMDVTVEDHNLVDTAVKVSGLNFVLVRCAMLKEGEAAKVVELGDEGERAGWMPMVSRRSVVLVLVDAVEQAKWDGRTPVIAN